VLDALAVAFGVPRHAVSLVRGATSRRKVVDIGMEGLDDEVLAERLGQLLRG
jgi:uncharacterized protein YggU (UPF0235/DUF167 family)